MEICPVAGSITAPWTNAACPLFASLHGPLAALVATSLYGVASPLAVSGLAGTINVQSPLTAAAWEPRCGTINTTDAMTASTSGTLKPISISGEKRLRRLIDETAVSLDRLCILYFLL